MQHLAEQSSVEVCQIGSDERLGSFPHLASNQDVFDTG